MVKPKTRPGPLAGRAHQAALDRVAVYIIQFFPPLLFAPHIQIIKAPLPDAIGAMKVHRGRQGESFKRVAQTRQGESAAFFLKEPRTYESGPRYLALRLWTIREGSARSHVQISAGKCSGIRT